MKRLYFMRHGLSEANVKGVYAGQTETPLTKEGRDQAKLAGQKCKELNIDHIISSPFSRAYDSAKIIAHEINYPIKAIELNSLFIERGFGELEGKPWMPDLNIDGFADIETLDSIMERMHLGYEYLKTLDAENILVVSHGATGRAIRSIINPVFPYKQADYFPNAEIVQLR